MMLRRTLITIITLCSLLAINACKDDNIDDLIGPTNTIVSNFYLQVVDPAGDTTTLQEGRAKVNNTSGSSSTTVDNNGTVFHRQSTGYTDGDTRVTLFMMEFFNSQPSQQQIIGMWQIGSYDFGNSLSNPREEGVEIIWIDENNVEWSTAKGVQDTSANFLLTNLKANEVDNETPYISEGMFNCQLFNGSGDTMTISWGRFVGHTVVVD